MVNNGGIKTEKYLTWICGFLLFVLCPFICPQLGEQHDSYIQLCLFTFIVYGYIAFQIICIRNNTTVRLADLFFFLGCCLYWVHSRWIVPVVPTMWGWLRFLDSIGLYMFVRLQTPERAKEIFGLFVVSGCVQSLYAMAQKIHLFPSLNSSFDMTGSFLNPAPLAGYLMVVVCVLVARFIFIPSLPAERIKWILSISLMAIVIFLLNSRAAYWSCLVVMGILLYKQKCCRTRSSYIVFGFILFVIFIFSSLFFLYQYRTVSANGRLFIWENTIRMIKEHPLTGVGIGNFKSVFPEYQAIYYQCLSDIPEKYYDGNAFFAFNEFLELYAEMGICFPFLILLFLGAWYKSRLFTTCHIYLYGIGGLLVFSCFSYPFSVFTLFVLFIYLVASLGYYTSNVYCLKHFHLIKLSLTILILFVLIFSLNGLNAAIRWGIMRNEQKFPHEIDFYSKYHLFFQNNISFTLHYYNATRENRNASVGLHVLNTAIQRIPLSGWYLLRGSHYQEMKLWDKAEQDFKFLLYLIPTQPEPVYKLAQLYVLTHREKDAVLLLERAFSFNQFQINLTNKMILFDMKKLYYELNEKMDN